MATAGAQFAFTAFSTLYGIKTSMDAASAQKAAASEAERIGRENAAAIEAETAEQARRMQAEQTAASASARAKLAASGVTGGSMEQSIGTMETEQARQLAWLKKSGKTKTRSAIDEAKYAGATGRAQASATMAGGISKALDNAPTLYSQGKTANWWG